MGHIPGRTPSGGQPNVDDVIQQARNLVEKSQYYDAESVVESLTVVAPMHPAINTAEKEELEAKHAAFQDELDTGRYVNSSDLTQLLDEIHALFAS